MASEASQFTLGIEEEFQLVDPETLELRSHLSEMIKEGRAILDDQFKLEMHKSVVEVGTNICQNVKEARAEVARLRSTVSALARRSNLEIVAASTHPFSDWRNQEITDNERYIELINDLQDIARANLIFGLHVHVGMPDREAAIALMNQLRYFLPHILALTTSSPFWVGRNTGLMSYRSEIFKRFPRTDIPDYFNSWSEYENYINLLVKTKCIDNGKKIWWDIRAHPFFGTLEMRICDLPTRMEETLAVAALFQALVFTLYQLYKRNMGYRIYRRSLIQENKWRALRYGLHGKLIDFGKQKEVPVRDLIYEFIRLVDDAVDELGSRDEINYIYKILEGGTSADRQLQVYEDSGHNFKDVVRFLIQDTLHDIEPPKVEKSKDRKEKTQKDKSK